MSYLSKKLILTLLACVPAAVHAGVVPVDDAKQLADDFFSAAGKGRSGPTESLKLAYTAGTSSRPLYYVFNATDGNGFVIVSADDRTLPVLGYSFENQYIADNVPTAMQWMMSGVEKEIKSVPPSQSPYTLAARRNTVRTAAAEVRSEKVLPTPEWSQEMPFNNAIPGRPLVGCVGTAMASIMKYHNHPAKGTGSFDGVNFDVEYDWDNMRTDNYRQGYTETEGNAVATLMWHASKSIDTQYGMSGSSAYEVRIPAALSNYFDYDPGVSYKKRSEVGSQQAWDKILRDEIDAGRPVLYCGQDVTEGHAFVCDGYDNAGYFHFNWGWGGAANGFFLSSALNPSLSKKHNFNYLQTIIYNIKPASGNSAWSTIHITADGGQPGIGSDLAGLTEGKAFTVRVGNLKNLAYTDFSGKIAVALFGADGIMKCLLSEPSNLNLPSMTTLGGGYVTFRNCILKSGNDIAQDDMVRIATSSDNGTKWLPVAGELLTVNEIPVLRKEPDYFTIQWPEPVAGATFAGNDKVIRGWDYTFTVTPANPAEDVVTVKANGYVLTPANGVNYTISNVKENQDITVLVQKASEIKEKRSIWVETAGTLSSLIPETETGTIKDLTLFGTIDARDFEFMRTRMRLSRLDISSVYIAAHGSSQAYALPKSAFQGQGQLTEVILPNNLNRINNAAFRQCGIESIVIPAGVRTYEYNVFLNASRLRDIWVGRETAEFINWCVLEGTNKAEITLHVPNEKAVSNYSSKENWKEVGHIVVDPVPAKNDFAFAVMDSGDVKFDSDTQTGRLDKGTQVTFTAEHIADNDDRMEVYANTTRLSPDANGRYTTVINTNTIIHFKLVAPIPCAPYPSPWQLTDTGGTVGLLTDVVNVIPGIDFSIRANALYIPAENASMFWAAVLTDKDGNIKEFISSPTVSSGAHGDGLRMTINCCVKEATVREGNTIRLATSYNNTTWALVQGKNADVVSSLPALNNQTPVYNINIPELPNATVSGAVSTAVRGRDVNLKIVPKSASDFVDVALNGDTLAVRVKSFSYSFIAKQDMDFDIKVYPPVRLSETTIELKEGEHLFRGDYGVEDEEIRLKLWNIQKLTIKGDLDYTDFSLFRNNPNIAASLEYLDLSEARIVADREMGDLFPADCFPAYAFCKSNDKNVVGLKTVLLPPTVRMIDKGAFFNCSKLKELTLPDNLYNYDKVTTASGGWKYDSGLQTDCFKGCTSLTTLFVPCAPKDGNQVAHIKYSSSETNNLGLPDCSKVTVVVKPEYLAAYKTPMDGGWFGPTNGWVRFGFNIVGEYPVYSLNYDASRCFVADDALENGNVSFLGDNATLENIDLTGKLFVGVHSQGSARPEGTDAYRDGQKSRIYDNDRLLPGNALQPDGSLSVTFWNPSKNADKCGNHDIRVDYLYDVKFICTSDIFMVEPEEVRNNEASEGDAATAFEVWNTVNALEPVLENVHENSVVRFRVGISLSSENNIEARVKIGRQVVSPDEDGYYTVNVTDGDETVEIFAVPLNGATLSPEEFNSIDVREAVGITSIALEGDVTPEMLGAVKDSFTTLEELDLSDMSGELPAGVFAGMSSLVTVALPDVDAIEAETFKDCSNLATVTVPESVSAVGDRAFSGCSALSAITLTGIDAIGAGAFDGCSNLTSISLNAPSSSASAERSFSRSSGDSRASGFSPKAFEGVNPNCLILVDDGVAVPATPGNYVRTTIGEITEEIDGKQVTRQGRIYFSGGDIALKAGHPLAIANRFTMGDGDEISLETAALSADGDGNWSSLVVPFEAENITLAADNTILKASTQSETDGCTDTYAAITLDAEKGVFTRCRTIEANHPYLLRIGAAAQNVRLIAHDTEIAATPADIKVSGPDFDLMATYRDVTAAETAIYILNEAGTAFMRTEEVADMTANACQAAPFSVYATSEAGMSSIEIVLDESTSSSTDAIAADDAGLTFSVENGVLTIYASSPFDTAIYRVDGTCVGTISLTAGRNAIYGLARGIYIVEGMKILF